MPVYDMPLSVAGIDEVIRELKGFRDALENAESQIVTELAAIGENDMVSRISAVVEPDGNIDTYASSTVRGNIAEVFLAGSQAAYIEFGTGVRGEQASHPLKDQVGITYLRGKHIYRIKSGKYAGQLGWKYFDRNKGKWRVTIGIEAQNIVFNTAQGLRLKVREVVREALR